MSWSCKQTRRGLGGYSPYSSRMRSHRESSKKVQSRAPARGRGAYYVCGSRKHRVFECLDRADTDDREKKKISTKRVTYETGKSSKNTRLLPTGIDIQDERREIRRMKTQMKLLYSCLTVTTTTTKSTW